MFARAALCLSILPVAASDTLCECHRRRGEGQGHRAPKSSTQTVPKGHRCVPICRFAVSVCNVSDGQWAMDYLALIDTRAAVPSCNAFADTLIVPMSRSGDRCPHCSLAANLPIRSPSWVPESE